MRSQSDASLISRTQSESTAGNSKNQLAAGTKEIIDIVFPFVDQMNTISRLPKVLSTRLGLDKRKVLIRLNLANSSHPKMNTSNINI